MKLLLFQIYSFHFHKPYPIEEMPLVEISVVLVIVLPTFMSRMPGGVYFLISVWGIVIVLPMFIAFLAWIAWILSYVLES